jgi:hypothetical protein
MAQATSEADPAAARLSPLHALMWAPPTNLDTMPTTQANIAKVRKNPVAPFPPKPGNFFFLLAKQKSLHHSH